MQFMYLCRTRTPDACSCSSPKSLSAAYGCCSQTLHPALHVIFVPCFGTLWRDEKQSSIFPLDLSMHAHKHVPMHSMLF